MNEAAAVAATTTILNSSTAKGTQAMLRPRVRYGKHEFKVVAEYAVNQPVPALKRGEEFVELLGGTGKIIRVLRRIK